MNQQLYYYMSAFPYEEVKEAFLQRNREYLQVKLDQVRAARERAANDGWTELDADKTIPDDHEWFTVNSKTFIRSHQVALAFYARHKAENVAVEKTAAKKEDLSMECTDKRCPVCGEVMAWEPICPGCALGKIGFRGRYVCMDDFDHTFYVTKPGMELPNR